MNKKENENIFTDKKERSAEFVIQRFTKNELSRGQSTLPRFNSIVKIWSDLLTRKNYVPIQNLKDILKELELPASVLENLSNPTKDSEDFISKSIYKYLTLKINKMNVWEHFYNFPELYGEYDVAKVYDCELAVTGEDGVLTREAVAICLRCLHKSPMSGVYTYIKLDLSSKRLVNIDVLEHYKYLVYLDLSSNCLTEIKVLSRLLYLQYLSLNFNKFRTVLDYDTPQWLLTEVYYGHNEVIEMRDLSLFWSITILDLSHNDIIYICGLAELHFLRRLDLSHNKIRRLGNLSNKNLLWLDLSYNHIASFECDEEKGLHTLHHLEYLDVSDNRIGTLKVFSACTRLRELRASNNGFLSLYEVPLCLWQLTRLITLDLRDNPLCTDAWYKDVVINTLPNIYQLDGVVMDPVDLRTSRLDMKPAVFAAAERRLLRLLYVQQLTRARVSPHVPLADTRDTPLVVLVGPEASGKGALALRITEHNPNIELAKQHTTSYIHSLDLYKLITRKNFDNMLLAGEFLTCSSVTDGGTCGLSREEAFVGSGKVKIVIMDLVGALMLRQRGYQPYLVLASCADKKAMKMRQEYRKLAKYSQRPNEEATTLQVLVSERIMIGGILQEIIRVATNNDDDSPSFLSTYTIGTCENTPIIIPCPCKNDCMSGHCKDFRCEKERANKQESNLKSETLSSYSLSDDKWITSQWVTPDNFVPSVEDDCEYENIHRNCPGMFWDIIMMDDANAAYKRLKNIIKNIVNEQKKLKLFNINFTIHNNNIFKKKMEKISLQLAQQRLFY